MSAKPTWASFLELPIADSDFLQDRSLITDKACTSMTGKIEFDGKNCFVIIPHELLDRADMKSGDDVEISGESVGAGYRIMVERSLAPDQEDQQDA